MSTRRDAGERLSRLSERLRSHADGIHRFGAPAVALDSELPAPVAAVYRELGAASLFFDALVLRDPTELREREGRWHVADADGDEIHVDADTGAVWRVEADTGEWLEEGTSFDRWLAGFVEAEGVLYDDRGEFRENVFDEAGELEPAAAMARDRAILKRDKNAIAPRWRLARALAREGEVAAARDALEWVVERRPEFGWAWYDLSRLAERLGQLDAARDDMRAAAEADPEYEHNAFFWAHLARLSEGDERAEAADRAQKLDPDMARSQRDAAAQRLAEGDIEGARELGHIASALAPRDLGVIDLLAKLRLHFPGDGQD